MAYDGPPRTISSWREEVGSLEVPDPLKRSLLAVTEAFLALSGQPAGATASDDLGLPEPYRALGRIGAGGMGEVWRVHDPRLNRDLALKILRADLAAATSARLRFLEEAQVTAQLQHPGIPPVHEVGVLADGRPYFAMLEVRGETLREAIARIDRAEPVLRGLVSAVQRAADAVAYAHSRGVVHRDLKPDNVMLGPFGEVWVVDWGLVRVEPDASAPPRTVRAEQPFATRTGAVQGTPAFMAPEQARGEPADARSDVYGLGAVLYAVLTGEPPHAGPSVRELLARVAAGPSPPVPTGAPEALAAICVRALDPDPGRRFEDAGALSDELRAYLDGARARDRAQALVAEADALEREAGALRERAVEARRQGEALSTDLAPDAAEAARWPIWATEDAADRLESEAALQDVRAELALEAALSHADLDEARARLAARHGAAHRRAEATGDAAATLRHEAYLRAHGGPAWAGYLEGRGRLTLRTDPPGAEVVVHRFEPRHRRLVPVEIGPAGRTPLVELPLDRGSYLLRLTAPGRAEVRYPVRIERDAHWDGVRPGSDQPLAVPLPPAEALGPDDVYVPAGWCWIGRDLPHDAEIGVPRQRVWVDGFVVRRFPVTNAEYVAFLDDLVARGDEETAVALAPRYSGRSTEPVWARDARGRFRLGRDAQGDLWLPEMPVVLVSWAAARAFAAWEAARTGQPWRLGSEIEWEKAARGVDGRAWPWGDRVFPGWARMRGSSWPAEGPVPVDAFPEDVSPHGVRGMAGNVIDWVLDPDPDGRAQVRDGVALLPDPEVPSLRRRVKGGSYLYRPFICRVDGPGSALAANRVDYNGFRLFRSWPE